MTASAAGLFASQGYFGPTWFACPLLFVLVFGPCLCVLVALRSILSAEPVSWWLLVPVTLGTGCLVFAFWPGVHLPRGSGFWVAWGLSAWAAVLAYPVVAVREAAKRDWFRGYFRRRDTDG
jgi:hypothetical protein